MSKRAQFLIGASRQSTRPSLSGIDNSSSSPSAAATGDASRRSSRGRSIREPPDDVKRAIAAEEEGEDYDYQFDKIQVPSLPQHPTPPRPRAFGYSAPLFVPPLTPPKPPLTPPKLPQHFTPIKAAQRPEARPPVVPASALVGGVPQPLSRTCIGPLAPTPAPRVSLTAEGNGLDFLKASRKSEALHKQQQWPLRRKPSPTASPLTSAVAPRRKVIPPSGHFSSVPFSNHVAACNHLNVTATTPVRACDPFDDVTSATAVRTLAEKEGGVGCSYWAGTAAHVRTPTHSDGVVSPAPVAATMTFRNETGFTNEGNTCYAASVLTMILRQTRVREELRRFGDRYRHVQVERIIDDFVPVEEESFVLEDHNDRDLDGLGHPEPEECLNPEERPQRGDADWWLEAHEAEYNSPWARRQRRPRMKRVSRKVMQPACPLHLALLDAVDRCAFDWTQDASSSVPSHGGISMGVIADTLREYTETVGLEFFDHLQHDAHEFYVALLAALETEALAAMTLEFERRQRKAARRLERAGRRGTSHGGDDANNSATECTDKASLRLDASPPAPRDTWVNRLFQGATHSITACRCEGCGMLQGSTELFVNLSLPLPPYNPPAPPHSFGRFPGLVKPPPPASELNTRDRIAASLQSDVLDTYRCDACRQTALQYHGSALRDVPPLLVVQWKRFHVSFNKINGCMTTTKNAVAVELSRRFDVVSFPSRLAAVNVPEGVPSHIRDSTSSSSVSEERGVEGATSAAVVTTYELRGFVLHRGATLESGHYVAGFMSTVPPFVCPDVPPAPPGGDCSNWFIADDEKVLEMPERVMERCTNRNTHCYLALYEAVERRDPSSPHSGGSLQETLGKGERDGNFDTDVSLLHQKWRACFPKLSVPPPPSSPPPSSPRQQSETPPHGTPPCGAAGSPMKGNDLTPPSLRDVAHTAPDEPLPATPPLLIRNIGRVASRSLSSEEWMPEDGPIPGIQIEGSTGLESV